MICGKEVVVRKKGDIPRHTSVCNGALTVEVDVEHSCSCCDSGDRYFYVLKCSKCHDHKREFSLYTIEDLLNKNLELLK